MSLLVKLSAPISSWNPEPEMSESITSTDYIQITADIVSAFVSNNAVRASELPGIIQAFHTWLIKSSDVKVEEPV